MPTWYILAVMDVEKEHTVYNTLCRSKNIKEVHPLFGEWDLIIKITGETEQLIKIVKEDIKIDGVLATKTLRGY